MHKHIKRKLKTLTHLKPDADKREHFRRALLSHIGTSAGARMPLSAPRFRFAPLVASYIVLCFVFGTGGASFAAQNAFPGELLYPVKIATEKMRIAIAANEVKKAELRLAFAERRLDEVNKLIDQNSADPNVTEPALAAYEQALVQTETALIQNQEKSTDIAIVIEEATGSHERAIKKIVEKIENKSSRKDLKERLEKAKEHAEEKGDTALLSIVSATSSESATLPASIVKKSRERVKRKEERVEETERLVEERRSRGENNDEAEEKLKDAKENINRAKSKLEEGDIRESVRNSIEAREKTREARDRVQKENED